VHATRAAAGSTLQPHGGLDRHRDAHLGRLGRPGHKRQCIVRYSDGAAYNALINSWRSLPVPLLQGRHHHTALWTGSEMIVWGGTVFGIRP
jgi:hypothetical protein